MKLIKNDFTQLNIKSMARNSFRKLRIAMVACFCIVATMDASETASNNFNTDITMDENQNLTQVWDKVFPQSNKSQ